MSHIHAPMFFWSPLFVHTQFSTTLNSHVFSISAPVFSLGSALNRPLESSTCFSRVQPLPRPCIVSSLSRRWWNMLSWKRFVNQSSSAAFAFNWSHFRGSSCHVLGALTDCSNLQNPQIIRVNAVVVSGRQNVCMLGFTPAISDFSKLETPLQWITGKWCKLGKQSTAAGMSGAQ